MERQRRNEKISLGIMKIASQGRPVVEIDDIYRHVYVVGKPRSGKTNFFTNCFEQLKDHAFVVLDPSGELAYDIAGLANPNRLVWVDKEHPLTINPLKRQGLSRGDLAKEFIEVIDNCVTETSESVPITPMMEEIIRNAVRAFKEEDLNLDFLCDFLQNERTRDKYRHDKHWSSFDLTNKSKYGYEKWQERDSAHRIATRISALYDYDDFKDFVIGENQFDIEQIVKDRKIIIFNLQGFNPDAKLYMGNLIMCAIKSYFNKAKGFKQPSLFVMVDEFYQFMSPAYKEMLTGASKHNIGMFLCHHAYEQVRRNVLEMAISISHIKVVLPVGSTEAKRMGEEFQLKQSDFLNLPKWHAQILIGNKPHFVRTLPPLEIPEFNPSQPLNFLRNSWIVLK